MLKKNLELQQQELCHYRNGLSQEETYQFKVNIEGHKGEVDTHQLILKHGNNDWVHLHDVWINAGGTTQLDIVIMTSSGIYIIDAKNYTVEFVHQNQQSYANGRLLNKSIFTQLERSMEKVNTMVDKLKYNGQVQGKIAFINPEGLIRLDQPAAEVGMNRAEFVQWIKQTAREEKNFAQANIKSYALRERIINEFQIENPFPPTAKTIEDIRRMKRGICCDYCNHFNLTITQYKVICNHCSHQEVKERAIVRTLCEYGVIRYNEPLIVSECQILFAGQVSKNYISKILRKHFTMKNRGRYTSYINKNEIFEYAFINKKFPFKNTKN